VNEPFTFFAASSAIDRSIVPAALASSSPKDRLSFSFGRQEASYMLHKIVGAKTVGKVFKREPATMEFFVPASCHTGAKGSQFLREIWNDLFTTRNASSMSTDFGTNGLWAIFGANPKA